MFLIMMFEGTCDSKFCLLQILVEKGIREVVWKKVRDISMKENLLVYDSI